MTGIAFHPDSEKELSLAVDYYDRCQAGLGLEFAQEVHRTLEDIIAFPKAWGQLSKNTRRCLVNRFPYGVIYSTERDGILILAVMHLNRRPAYWKRRKKPVKAAQAK